MSSVPTELLSLVPPDLRSVVENYWADWCLSCDEKLIDPPQQCTQQKLPLASMGYVWACSDFVARNSIRYPDTFISLCEAGFESARSADDYIVLLAGLLEQVTSDDELMSALRKLRQQEMMRIAWRDLNRLADDEIILYELSDFSEAVVSLTLQ